MFESSKEQYYDIVIELKEESCIKLLCKTRENPLWKID